MSDILFVCEGNTCRSPYAEFHLRHALGPGQLTVASAGVHAVVGAGMDDVISGMLADEGVRETESHRARQVTSDDLRDSALVLTATRRIRSKVVELHAPAVRYTFTVRQFGDMLRSALDHDPGLTEVRTGPPRQMLLELVSGVRSARGVLPTRAVENDDVVDPVGRAPELYEQAVAELAPALADLDEVVRAWSGPETDRTASPLTSTARS